jgi:dihydrofolate reductase
MDMGKVTTGFSMSLDGFVAGPNDSPDKPLGEGGNRLFKWYSSDQEGEVPMGGGMMKMSREGAELVQEAGSRAGVLVTARRTFDIANAWGGRHPMDVPVVVITHTVPQEWANKKSIFTFVTDGVESAMEKARQIAGDKYIVVGAPSVVKQCLKAGLMDEIHIDLIPILLFDGVRLFDVLGVEPVDMKIIEATANSGVAHITFRIIK